MQETSFIQVITPRVSKRTLFFMAALVWTFAGGMLLFKGISILCQLKTISWLRMVLSAAGGILFYILLFSKISLKHTRRIVDLKIEKPCLFSFFNFKSYLLMILMISGGITLRKTGALSPDYLTIVYMTMGIPLFLSSMRFYYYGFLYKRLVQ